MDIKKLFGTTNLYKILNLESDATIQESNNIYTLKEREIVLKTFILFLVKKSYYKLALKYHPDRVSAEEKCVANQKFTIVHQAYSILTNSEMKKTIRRWRN